MNVQLLHEALRIGKAGLGAMGHPAMSAELDAIDRNLDLVVEVVEAVEAHKIDRAAVVEAFKAALTAGSDAVMKAELEGEHPEPAP